MKYFRYILTSDELTMYKGEIETIPPGFIESTITLSGLSVYYKIEGVKITEIIGEAIHENAARRRVDEFISSFLATSFEPL
jgi:hypothetical protein